MFIENTRTRLIPGAGQHGDYQLCDHWHVDGNAVALPDSAFGLEHVGELAHVSVELGVSNLALVFRIIALPVKCNLQTK